MGAPGTDPRPSKLKLICFPLEIVSSVLMSWAFRIKDLILSTFYSLCLQQQFKHGASYKIHSKFQAPLSYQTTHQQIEIEDRKATHTHQFLLIAHNVWQTYTSICEGSVLENEQNYHHLLAHVALCVTAD